MLLGISELSDNPGSVVSAGCGDKACVGVGAAAGGVSAFGRSDIAWFSSWRGLVVAGFVNSKLAFETGDLVSVLEFGLVSALDFVWVATRDFCFEPLLLIGNSSMDDGCDMLSRNCIGFEAQPLNHTRLPTVKKQRTRDKCRLDWLQKCLNGDLFELRPALHFRFRNFLFIITLHNNSLTARAIHFDRVDGAVKFIDFD